MKHVRMLALAGAAVAALASPALADWDTIGTLPVGYGAERDSASPNFGGPVEALQFTAVGGDVQCRTIRASYANGGSSDVFTGALRRGQSRAVDLPGAQRTITHMDFFCRSDRSGASIRLDANVGQFRAQWRASPDWARNWQGRFHWGDDGRGAMSQPHVWTQIGSAQFAGRDDRDGSAAGWHGVGVDQLGFKPINGDAACREVKVRFHNGETRRFDLNNAQPMMRGQTYRIDLPGDYDNVDNVGMRCHALGQYAVTINIFGRK